jgi:Fur family ferric uptake transcriptional regulator
MPSTQDQQPVNADRLAGRLRTTRQGESVDALLRESEVFRTAQDLHAELRSRGESVGLTTVYRHLGMLANAGQVDIVHRPDGEAQYRFCGTGNPTAAGVSSHEDHHHHVVCRVCGRAEQVEGPEVERWAERVARKAGFTEVTHTLEVFGLCPEHS